MAIPIPTTIPTQEMSRGMLEIIKIKYGPDIESEWQCGIPCFCYLKNNQGSIQGIICGFMFEFSEKCCYCICPYSCCDFCYYN